MASLIPLQSQEQFEAMYSPGPDQPRLGTPVLIWFSAKWCGPCRKVNADAIAKAFPKLPFYKCDIDENDYTPGFCGVRAIPSFIIVFPTPRTLAGPFQNSDSQKIIDWVQNTLSTK